MGDLGGGRFRFDVLVSRFSRGAARRRRRFSLGHAADCARLARCICAPGATKHSPSAWRSLVDARRRRINGHRRIRIQQRRLAHRPGLCSQRPRVAVRRCHCPPFVDFSPRAARAQPVAGNRPHFHRHRLRQHLKYRSLSIRRDERPRADCYTMLRP